MYLTLYLAAQVATALGILVSAACDSMETATSIAMIMVFPFVIFSGLVVNAATMPPSVTWL